MNIKSKLEPLGKLDELKYTDIQYSEVQRKHIVSKPLKQVVKDIDLWLDGFLETKPFVAEYCDEKRSLNVRIK